MRSRLTAAAAVLGALVGIGLASAGYFVGEALKVARSSERFVTVRGFAERNVESNLVIWPITFRDTGNDLVELQKTVDSHKSYVKAFLAESGFRPEEVSEMPPQVTESPRQSTRFLFGSRVVSGRGSRTPYALIVIGLRK